MHHKRRRPKHQRAGCLYCKPHKDERERKQLRIKGLKGPRLLGATDCPRKMSPDPLTDLSSGAPFAVRRAAADVRLPDSGQYGLYWVVTQRR
jgi:hypothetical protein